MLTRPLLVRMHVHMHMLAHTHKRTQVPTGRGPDMAAHAGHTND